MMYSVNGDYCRLRLPLINEVRGFDSYLVIVCNESALMYPEDTFSRG